MTKTIKIDWFAATADLSQQDIFFDTLSTNSWKAQKPMLGYPHVWKDDRGIFFCTGMPKREAHFHFIMGGQALDALRLMDVDEHRLLDFSASVNARCSRCDVALDIRDEYAYTPSGWYDAFGLSQTTGYMKKRTLMEGNDGGSTVYFGSGASNTQVCVYDKARERGLPDENWIRCEIRLKGKKAWQVLPSFIKKGVTGVYDLAFNSAIDGEPLLADTWLWGVRVGELDKPTPDTSAPHKIDEWLIRQVAPALTKAIKNGDTNVLWRLEEMVSTGLVG